MRSLLHKKLTVNHNDHVPQQTCPRWLSERRKLILTQKAGKIQGFSYDLEMKRTSKTETTRRTEIERFDWFIERVAFGWLSKRSGKRNSCSTTF